MRTHFCSTCGKVYSLKQSLKVEGKFGSADYVCPDCKVSLQFTGFTLLAVGFLITFPLLYIMQNNHMNKYVMLALFTVFAVFAALGIMRMIRRKKVSR